MSTNDKTGGPAFPWAQDESTLNGGNGMTMRQWYAGQVAPALIATIEGKHSREAAAAMVASAAFLFADAMIAFEAGEDRGHEA